MVMKKVSLKTKGDGYDPTQRRFAQMWCELNCWKIPPELLYGFEASFARAFMTFCKTFTTSELLDEEWMEISDRDISSLESYK